MLAFCEKEVGDKVLKSLKDLDVSAGDKIMKNLKWLIASAVLCMAMIMAGCNTAANTDNRITIVCTSFPLYDWTSQLLEGCDAEVILLLNNGADMHSFQPSAQELIQIADCDVLIHVGGESDAWLVDALKANPSGDRVVVNLMEILEEDICKTEYVEGMQTDHIHEDGSVCSEIHLEHEEGAEITAEELHSHVNESDEHVWLSLRMAVKACAAIEEALCAVLPEDKERISGNNEMYCNELRALDQMYADMVMNHTSEPVVIVADRFPFMYMMKDYGIEYYAAFPGCSTESEADFETVVFLAEKTKEHNTKVLLITESGTDTLAKAVYENAGLEGEVTVLHSMQVVYQSDIEAGASYIAYMEDNLKVLEQVLQ